MSKNLDRNVNHRLATVATLTRRLVFRVITDSGLEITPEQWTILHYLWRQDGLTMSELVKHTRKDFANLTRIVDKLIRDGYVCKERDKTDSRSYRVYLLPKAGEIKEQVEKVQNKALNLTIHEISMDEQDTMLSLLNRMEANIMEALGNQ